MMREIVFTWGGQERRFIPSMAVLSAMASDLARASEGGENTAVLASKLLHGGADPVFASLALYHMLRASGADVTREDAYAQILGGGEDMVGFRQAYITTVLPNIDMGKKPEAPVNPAGAARGRRKK